MKSGGKHERIRKRHSLQMGPWVTALALFVVSVLITLCCAYMQTVSPTETIAAIWNQPLLIPLNWFPAAVFLLTLYFAFKNVFFAGAVSGGVMSALSYINLLKFEGREDNLVPADILLFREAVGAVRDYQLEMHWDKIAVIAAFVLVMVLLGILFRSAYPKLPVRAACALLCVLLFVLSVRFVYTDKELYNSFRVPEQYNIGSVYNTLGFNYCFLYNFRLYPVDKPDGFSRSEAESWEVTDPGNANPLDFKPNIIIVMCEAFSDLSAESVFTYTEDENPLRDYYRACDSELALSGHILVSNYAAGTANTEFNVMTGMQTNMIGEGTTSAFRVVRKQTDSIARVLAADGYNTFFMHPGQSWFYNRSSVYDHFGITDQVFSEAFDESDYKGNMISDAAFLEELKTDLKQRMLERTEPLFAYTVTIQNHQAYQWTKYMDTTIPDAKVSVPLSDASLEQVSGYLEGVRDSSAMLLELTEYLDSLEEPTLLVFFGDHRPNLGDAAKELGLPYNTGESPADVAATYAVPFMINCVIIAPL